MRAQSAGSALPGPSELAIDDPQSKGWRQFQDTDPPERIELEQIQMQRRLRALDELLETDRLHLIEFHGKIQSQIHREAGADRLREFLLKRPHLAKNRLRQ